MIQNSRKSVSNVGMKVIGRRIVQTTWLREMDSGVTESLVIEVSFIVSTSDSWCVDSGATNHICNAL